MITPGALKQKVIEEFEAASLLNVLQLESSLFRDLPHFFEVSHLSMRLVLNDVAAMATAGILAAKLKRDLQEQGVELEYTIAARWKVSKFPPDILECGSSGEWMPSENFHVEVESGSVKRLAAVCVSPEAAKEIRRCVSHVPIQEQQSAIHKLLEACLNRQLVSSELGRWDPILYPNRTIAAEEIAQVAQSCVDVDVLELQSQLG
jgi:hypothetical protein